MSSIGQNHVQRMFGELLPDANSSTPNERRSKVVDLNRFSLSKCAWLL